MTLSAFPWPGGKTHYISQILPFFPDHRRYVEPFGGSAALLLNKPKSYVEVFNDLDDDVVHFFRTLREQREELQEWLRAVPYSESLHKQWQDECFDGHRPEDDVERAGRWLFLRCTTYGGSAGRRAGFKRPGKRNEARSFRGNVDNLTAIIDRFQEVTIANEDYRTVLDRYDHEETLFYIDPPYVDVGEQYYPAADGFDFEAFVDALRDRDGHWIVSSGDLPDGLEKVATTTCQFTAQYSLPNASAEERQEEAEHLSMNFDPEAVPEFLGQQSTLFEAADRENTRYGEPGAEHTEVSRR